MVYTKKDMNPMKAHCGIVRLNKVQSICEQSPVPLKSKFKAFENGKFSNI
jgi:hypothetical protein